jgi:uncharacterized membrane protein YsdA (DUF1294 family)/cold shock CspA family protein
MIPGPVRREGTITSWNTDRGFGFIAPAVGGKDVFVHISALPSGSAAPRVGDVLTFELQVAADGKQRAKLAKVERAAAGRADHRPARARDGVDRAVIGFAAIGAFAILYVVVWFYWHLPLWVLVLYVTASVAAFLAYAFDKSAAREGRWRVAESSLIALGVIGGWPGAIIAQQLLRHKTRKRSFRIAFWGSVWINVVAFMVLSYPGVPAALGHLFGA